MKCITWLIWIPNQSANLRPLANVERRNFAFSPLHTSPRPQGEADKPGFPRRFIELTLTGWLAIFGWGNPVLAQITPDETLGAEPSTVTPNVNIKGAPAEQIDGGAIRGSNLFHSFREFNVGDGQRVYFNNPTGIQNILSRVTGNDPSDILGTLGVINGNANLFFINPNGIIFGRNARLDVGGSFVATTANALQFGNQGFFSATTPNVPQLLTVNPSALLFNQINAARIENRSQAPADNAFGLRVPNSRSLLLVGGDILVDEAGLYAGGGRLELAGVAASGTVGLNVDGNNLNLSVPVGVQRADVLIQNGSNLNVVGENGGNIAIHARNLQVSDGSFIVAGIGSRLGTVNSKAGDISLNATEAITFSSSELLNFLGLRTVGQGGDIKITANSLLLRDNSIINAVTLGRGNAGSVVIEVAGLVSLSGSSTIFNTVEPQAIGTVGGITLQAGSLSLTEGAELQAATEGQGNAGNVTIVVRDRVSFDGVDRDGFPSGIFSTVFPSGIGNGGNIALTAGSLSVTNGARLQTKSEGLGNSGNVTIDVGNHISLDGLLSQRDELTGVFTTVETDSISRGGDIKVTAGSLSVANGAQLTATTFKGGNAGNVTMNVRDRVSFDGANINGSSGVFSATAPGAMGNGGNIDITAGSLSVSNGALLSAVTGSTGDAGRVTINTRETVSLDGIGSDGTPSGISTFVLEPEATGNANNIDITTGLLSVTNGARISSSTLGKGNAGNISVTANTLEVNGGGQLRSSTSSGSDAGNIILKVQDRVLLSGKDTGIFANTERGSTGKGGSILIDPRSVILRDGARIAVNSQGSGEGGNIQILADSLSLDNQASISADTASNTGGNIQLQLQDLLLLRRGSKISTNAGTDEAGGDGGNIKINAQFIVAVPKENSDITANAFKGRGGNVNITTQGIYGLQFQQSQTELSDITASSRFGLAGVVEINTPQVDPAKGLVQLPGELVDAAGLIAQNLCTARGEDSEFVVTGRGGLPSSPQETLNPDATWEDWRLVDGGTRGDGDAATRRHGDTGTRGDGEEKLHVSGNIVEAQGWVVDADGTVILTAEPVASTVRGTWLQPLDCQQLRRRR